MNAPPPFPCSLPPLGRTPRALSLKETLGPSRHPSTRNTAPPRTFPNTANLAFNTVLPGKSLEVVSSLATALYCHRLRL